MHIIINIGRNIGDAPMTQGRWDAFRQEVRTTIRAYTVGDPVAEYRGTAQWGETTEECASIQRWNVTHVDVDKIRRDLKEYAALFRQEAIALTVAGGSELIEP